MSSATAGPMTLSHSSCTDAKSTLSRQAGPTLRSALIWHEGCFELISRRLGFRSAYGCLVREMPSGGFIRWTHGGTKAREIEYRGGCGIHETVSFEHALAGSATNREMATEHIRRGSDQWCVDFIPVLDCLYCWRAQS